MNTQHRKDVWVFYSRMLLPHMSLLHERCRYGHDRNEFPLWTTIKYIQYMYMVIRQGVDTRDIDLI